MAASSRRQVSGWRKSGNSKRAPKPSPKNHSAEAATAPVPSPRRRATQAKAAIRRALTHRSYAPPPGRPHKNLW